ncbi:DEAD/DEAH box helicase [Legionella pneumophila]|uniref:DEAD/DEAH box helicase n=1 Tax=Legionella pneumophila TaxID=446 RepID=UPI0024B7EC21|nr:DEAD/DEAH box helicase [Legionella pneumophila]MDI9851275.1 DEAD/DEAH box helicase [Legionella pneumophila]
MRHEQKSQQLLSITRSKAKMFEYSIPEEYHINILQDPAKLFTISIALLGDLVATINRDESDPEFIEELRKNLLFSAHFFDSYLQSKLNESLDPYLVLLGSATYYLCDLPGSASVFAKHIDGVCPDLDAGGLESLLLWLLQADLRFHFDEATGAFGRFIVAISKGITQFFKTGIGEDSLLDWAKKLREAVYEFGTPRQLLFGDVITAVLKKKIENSVWKALPLYSELPISKWIPTLLKISFIKELWPAQHLLGKADLLKGKSAIVQMPTSAGKTKAIELILRSAFLAERISLAIIVAPFRALCHEIKNSLGEAFYNELIKIDELSDALQTDFKIAELLGHQQILVVTPEKLLYVLRHAPEMASHIGLLVLDEGHQFDSGTRGITYELLLTSLRSMIPEGTQKVLISAVISNAKAVGEWLNGEPNVVEGTTLTPTFKSVGFASWLDQLGRIEYVDSRNAEQNEFFVPRVIERFNLGKKKQERADRFFPEKSDGQAIALYLGLKLVSNGSIAIFCGRKSTAATVCEKVMDIIERGAPFELPLKFSNSREVERLTYLHIENLGAIASASKSAEHGIFSHHGNTPHGIRLAVEYAMRNDLVRFVVCTSTLAQGVNLPIRYLIVTSLYQGLGRIKIRDFHNLIGRAGRAGMYTEGGILFADPVLYDTRKKRKDKWRWEEVKKLLDPCNSEPCISNLLSIFDPIKSDNGKITLVMDALEFSRVYIRSADEVNKLTAKLVLQNQDKGFSMDGVEWQIASKINLICAVESFLLSHWDETKDGLSKEDVIRLAQGTLAFFLADNDKKAQICKLFQLLSENISVKINEPDRRKIYGRTLYGLQDAQAIERWAQSNANYLFSVADETQILDLVWPLLTEHINVGIFTKFDKPEVLKDLARGWIDGKSFKDLLDTIHRHNAKMICGSIQRRAFKIEHVVDICEGTLAYDGALLIGALCEFIEILNKSDSENLLTYLQFFQKRLKYGLPTQTTIALYELGFSDRVISQDIAISLGLIETQKKELVKELKKDRKKAITIIEKYPAYFHERMNELLR